MTSQSKTTIKSYFETGDKPTQAQFVNFIDSYQDVNSNLTMLASASVGAFGLTMLSTATTAAALNSLGPSTLGSQLFSIATTAAAQNVLGSGTVGSQLFSTTTTAAAQNILGAGAVGVQLFQSTTSAAALNALGTIPIANGGTGDTGTVWTSYTPTITAAAGSFTTVAGTGRYKTLGKTVFLEINIVVTTVGTASVSVNATLPFQAAAANYIISGKEIATGGFSMNGEIDASTSLMAIRRYDGTFYAINASVIVMTGVYESI